MKKYIFIAALAGLGAMPAGAENSDGSSSTLATFVDFPTGFNFVWRRDSGWTFAGGGPRPVAGEFKEGEPLAEMIDGPTGFRFVWQHGSGWRFAGQAAGR